jgi:hypothetical protein
MSDGGQCQCQIEAGNKQPVCTGEDCLVDPLCADGNCLIDPTGSAASAAPPAANAAPRAKPAAYGKFGAKAS